MQTFTTSFPMAPAFWAGLLLSLSLIMALGPQNVHVMRMGLQGQHVWLTVGLCIVSDALLIGLGVTGLARLGDLSLVLKNLLLVAGIAFLLVYGAQALHRFCAGSQATAGGAGAGLGAMGASTKPMTRRKASVAALAFAWLNPHAWLDTAVLIGSASMAWGQPAHAVFGVGAAVGSAIWFTGLGLAVILLGQRLQSAKVWRVLDGLVAATMWGTAAALARGLMAP